MPASKRQGIRQINSSRFSPSLLALSAPTLQSRPIVGVWTCKTNPDFATIEVLSPNHRVRRKEDRDRIRGSFEADECSKLVVLAPSSVQPILPFSCSPRGLSDFDLLTFKSPCIDTRSPFRGFCYPKSAHQQTAISLAGRLRIVLEREATAVSKPRMALAPGGGG